MERNWSELLRRPNGLCTSIARTDLENSRVIRAILDAYDNNLCLQMATRDSDIWQYCEDLPMNFQSFKYRVYSGDVTDDGHEHQWGPLEQSRICGTTHRKCQVPFCKAINLLDDEPEDEE